MSTSVEQTIFKKEYDLWKQEGVLMSGICSLTVRSTESDMIVVFDDCFTEPVLYREAGLQYYCNHGRCYVRLDEETPGITDGITERLGANRLVQAAEKEAVHVCEMASDLKTKQGRKRFLDVILSELADKDVTAIPKHLGGHMMAKVMEKQRIQKKKDRTMYLGLPRQWSAVELISARGDILVLCPDTKAYGVCRRLLARTVSGDISIGHMQTERIELTTTGGDITVEHTDSKRLHISSLGGKLLWRHSTAKWMECKALRGGACLTEGTLRQLVVEAKADRVELSEINARAIRMSMAAAETVLREVATKELAISSTLGDIYATLIHDVQAELLTAAGDIFLTLENGYRGFTAKVEDGRTERKRLRVKLRYGRFVKDYEGDCKIACNEKKSHLHILSKGGLVELTGSAKR